MRLSSFNLLIMLLMLGIGAALGAGLFSEIPNTMAAADLLAASDAPVSKPVAGTDSDPAPALDEYSESASYLGVIFARQSADVVARAEGILQSVPVNLGDRLKAGDVIARTESHSSTQRLQMAEATLRLAQAELLNAELEVKDAETRFRRRVELAKDGLISTEEFSTAQVQFDKAKAKVQAALAHVAEETVRINEAKDSLADTVVRAPFDGIVAARFLDAGAPVRFGTPVISLMRPDDLWVRFAIPQDQRSHITVGTAIELQLEHSSLAIAGVVEYVSPTITSASQELLVEARLKVPASFQDQVKAGETGIVSSLTR